MNCQYYELFNETTDVYHARDCQEICYKMKDECKSFLHIKPTYCRLYSSDQKTCKSIRGPPLASWKECRTSTR